MKVVDAGPDEPFFRALSPQWAYLPESGAGAAEKGGRFNRPGVEARYLSRSAQTALLEYQAESALLLPATVVTFLVTAKNLVDFSCLLGRHSPTNWEHSLGIKEHRQRAWRLMEYGIKWEGCT